MNARIGFGEVKLEVSERSDAVRGVPSPETPFRILLLGDFSGHDSRAKAATPLARRRPQSVDRDNFDDVLRKSGVELQIPLGDARASLWFSELSDFEPGRMYARLPLFEKLREVRNRLQDPAEFREAAASLDAPAGDAPIPDASRMASRGLLDEAILSTENRGAESIVPDEFAAFVNRAVAPHLTPKSDPKQAELIALVDQAASAQMRALLHLPGFQALESAWRGVEFVVRRIEDDSRIKLHILDVSKQELAEDVGDAQNVKRSALYKLMAMKGTGATGGEPWALIAGDYIFDYSERDVSLLSRFAELARAAGAPFAGGASLGFIGCHGIEDLAEPDNWIDTGTAGEAWETLRQLPEARYLGLALPRFLLRLPYGQSTRPVEEFNFEEAKNGLAHEEYLWGNPAFLCVSLLAESFAEEGWQMRPGNHAELGGLPLHVYHEAGESVAKPVAEALVPEEVALRVLDAGVMPIVSFKNRDSVRFLRFQSIASPPKELAGRWG